MFDTHVHFDSFGSVESAKQAVRRAAIAGVGRFIAVGGSPEANSFALSCATAMPGEIRACLGYDRYRSSDGDSISTIRDAVRTTGLVVAIGETGLDYHYDRAGAAKQRDLFEAMLSLAAEMSLPVVVHSREAEDDTVAMLSAYVSRRRDATGRLGVVHCFTGGREFAERVLDVGFYVSFSGIVTFKSASDIRNAARFVPSDRFLLETDTPYLAPVPCRGSSNEPALLVHTAALVADVRGVSVETVSDESTRNAGVLFGWRGEAEGPAHESGGGA